jgi:arginyl-tRNA synthetase
MQYLETIKKEIEKTLKENFGVENVNFQVGFPENLDHGDITTNVCLVVSKLVGKSPMVVGKILLEKIRENTELSFINKIDQVGPGFVNIWLKPENLEVNLENFKSKKYLKKKILVEHTSINLFKPFGIGHMMTNFTGEFVNRITKFVGANSVNISYPSDKSIGIAKAIYTIKQDGGLGQVFFQNENISLSEVVKYLGQCYVRGVNDFKKWEEENNQEKIREVKNIANNIYNEEPGEDFEIFKRSKQLNINYFKNFVENLGSCFEDFIYESEAGVEGKKIVLENTQSEFFFIRIFSGRKIFTRSEGAVVYIPDKDRKDINTSVFINSEGNPTYLAKDIGLLSLKFKKYNPDLSINVVDNEQSAHFKSVFDAGGKIKKEWEEKSVHVSHGRMTFKGKKMSSRLGGVPSGEEVINAVLEEVKEKSAASNQQGSTLQTQREIALSALRVAILRSKPGVNIDFDPEKSLSFEGDSGPYLCYTHARCCSLLEKVNFTFAPNLKLNLGSNNLSRKLFQFEKIVVDSAEEIAPQKLIKYLFEVAGEFNNFYAHNKIITDNYHYNKKSLAVK